MRVKLRIVSLKSLSGGCRGLGRSRSAPVERLVLGAVPLLLLGGQVVVFLQKPQSANRNCRSYAVRAQTYLLLALAQRFPFIRDQLQLLAWHYGGEIGAVQPLGRKERVSRGRSLEVTVVSDLRVLGSSSL